MKEEYGETTRRRREKYKGGSCLLVGELKEEYMEIQELKEEYMEIQEADEIKVKQEEMRNQEMTMNTGEEEWVPYNQEEEVAGLARVEKPPDLLASVLQEIGGVAEFGAVGEHEGSSGYFDLTDSQL